MAEYAITLTEDELMLVREIEFDASKLDHEAYVRQAPLILDLLRSLVERNAIPEIRLRYWTDPSFKSGRIKASHKELFERNGTKGQEIYTHPSFLKYLRYFIYGANLPAAVVAAFENTVGNPDWVSSGDIQGICKSVRALMRQFALDKGRAPEEFYRLSLDFGLSHTYAEAVKRAAKQVR